MTQVSAIISEFRGKWSFLSNFHMAPITFEGAIYPSSEHAYQAAKTLDPVERKMIADLATPGEAKRAGKKVTRRPDFESIKLQYMRYIVWLKFSTHPNLGEKLIRTGNARLVEGNNWGDTYWGVVEGQGGENWLGRILEEVREELVKQRPVSQGISHSVGQRVRIVGPVWGGRQGQIIRLSSLVGDTHPLVIRLDPSANYGTTEACFAEKDVVIDTAVDKVFTPGPDRIFVFGSNLSGIHGAGAAKHAFDKFGAQWHKGEGIQGLSYGIPTKDKDVMTTLPLSQVKECVDRFLDFARANPQLYFFVTRIGCGLAGFTDEEIGPLFKGSPQNCELPHGWG